MLRDTDHIPQFVSRGNKTIAGTHGVEATLVALLNGAAGADKDGWRTGLKMAVEGRHGGLASVYVFGL